MSILVDKTHACPGAGHHRPRGHLPHRADGRLRHQRGRRRHARQGRRVRSPACRSSTPCRGRRARPAPTPSIIYVPARFAPDAILEAADAGIELIVCITEGIPVLDMVQVCAPTSTARDARLIGPNCPGADHARRGQGRHHARPHSHARDRRRRLAQRHADLRSRRRADRAAASASRTVRRHRRRPDHRHRPSSTCWSCSRTTRRPRRSCMIGEIGGTDEEKAAAVHRATT